MRVYTVIEIVNNILDLYPCGIGSIVLMYKNATPIPRGKYRYIGGKMCGSLLEKYRHKNVLSVYRDWHETRTDCYLVLDLLEEQDMGMHRLYQREPSFKLTISQVKELKQCYGGETTIDQMLAYIHALCNPLRYINHKSLFSLLIARSTPMVPQHYMFRLYIQSHRILDIYVSFCLEYERASDQ